jgi:NAD(P)H-dependent flavin oxidoreductase YrpB (nitropropane dioxygenase family)
MGARFAATVESSAPDVFKQMYVDATDEDMVLIASPV